MNFSLRIPGAVDGICVHAEWLCYVLANQLPRRDALPYAQIPPVGHGPQARRQRPPAEIKKISDVIKSSAETDEGLFTVYKQEINTTMKSLTACWVVKC